MAQIVTNIGYSGAAEPSTMKTLMMRSGETLFVGDDNSTPTSDGYPTAIRPEVSRVPDIAVTAAAATGEWVGECHPEDNADYNAAGGAAVEWLNVTATDITITSTYYSTTHCGWSDSLGLGSSEVRESMTFSYSVSGTTNLLTERGMATGIDMTLTDFIVTPLSGPATTVLIDANSVSGAFNYTGWVAGTPYNVTAGTGVAYDGGALPTGMKVAVALSGDRFYARGGDPFTNIPYQSPSGVGFPLTVGTQPLLRSHDISSTALLNADMVGNWFQPCILKGAPINGYSTGAIVVGSGQLYQRDWTYVNGATDCSGAATQANNFLWTHTVQSTTLTAHGTAVELQLVDPGVTVNTMCILLIRAGGRLYGSGKDLLSTGNCTPADYHLDVSDTFSSLQTATLTAAPLSTYVGTCRDRSPGFDEREYLTFHPNAMAGRPIQFTSAGGLCTGGVSSPPGFSGTLTFGGTVAVAEGTATQVSVFDDTGVTMNQIVMWMDDLVWSGDDQGPMSGGYPTEMIPGDDLRRIY